MKRVVLTVPLLLTGWFAFSEFVNVAVCDGWYDLIVEISPELFANAESIACVGASNADMAASYAVADDEMWPDVEKSESSHSLTLHVGFSCRASGLLGRTWGHVQQYSHVVVVISRSDGSREVYIAPVPHRDVSKHIVVTASSAAS